MGRLARAANYPTRWTAARINATAEAVARARSRDAGLQQAEHIATRRGPSSIASAVATLLRYEQNHKDRAGASTAIKNQLITIKAQESARN